jgi:nicotinamidase-related amidase
MGVPRLKPNDTALLVVDMQEKLVPAMREPETLTRQVTRLIDGVQILGIPALVTEQYPKGLGQTVDPLASRLETAYCRAEKTCFTACIESIKDALDALNVHCVVVAGIEAHVCVMQTCLDLVNRGYVVGAALDAISARHPHDQDLAERRLQQAGVLPLSVESALMELIGDASDSRFKQIRELIK